MVIIGTAAIAVAMWVWLGSRVGSRLHIVAGVHRDDEARSGSTAPSRRRNRSEERRLHIVAQAPIVADLLGAAVAAGASVPDALDVVISAVEDPVRSRLESVRASVELGAPTTVAWAELLDEEALAPIASAVIRSAQTGSTMSTVLDAAAADMRQAHRAQVEVAARSAGVRSVAPLALCFLPAYLLVGVVPVVAGFAQSLFG